MKTYFRTISLFLAALIASAAVFVTAAPAAMAVSDGVYTVKLNRYYFDPNTGADASGSTTNEAVGQGMVDSAVSDTGLLEVVDGTCYLTVRIILASSINNFSAFVRSSGSTGYSEGGYSGVSVTKTQSNSANNTADYCFKIPSTSCTVAGGMYVSKMGSDVVFFLTLGNTTAGSGDFTVVHYVENNSGTDSDSTGDTGEAGGTGSSADSDPDKMTAVDTAALERAVVQAETLAEGDYTSDSWMAFQAALTTAQGLISGGDAGQETVDTAAAALTEAIAALEMAVTVDTMALEETIAQAAALVEGDYTAESWAALEKALTVARETAADEAAAQEEIDAAAAALTEAIDALEEAEIVDMTDLNFQIARAADLNEEGYTAESWAALEEAWLAAEDVASSAAVTQEASDDAAADLAAAISNLVECNSDSTGLIVGIVFATVVVLAGGGVTVWLLVIKKRRVKI